MKNKLLYKDYGIRLGDSVSRMNLKTEAQWYVHLCNLYAVINKKKYRESYKNLKNTHNKIFMR